MQLNTLSDLQRFLDKTRSNLLALERNLVELGYIFADSTGPIQIADASDLRMVDELETCDGELPALYRHWYRTFRAVNFSQVSDQRDVPNEDAVAGLGVNCPLVFLDLNSCVSLREELSKSGIDTKKPKGSVLMPTGGSASNCMFKGVWIPDPAIDPVLYDEGFGPVTMATEVNSALAVGGFPFWDRLFRKKRFKSAFGNTPAYRELKPALMRGLIPCKHGGRA